MKELQNFWDTLQIHKILMKYLLDLTKKNEMNQQNIAVRIKTIAFWIYLYMCRHIHISIMVFSL